MRFVILDNNYPHEENLYGDVFAHVRVKSYQEHHECVVCSLTHSNDYEYEGVTVKAFRTEGQLLDFILAFSPDLLLVHFANGPFIDGAILPSGIPTLVWVHGYEALAWTSRIFQFPWRACLPHKFLQRSRSDKSRLAPFKRLVELSNRTGEIRFLFVSEWMRGKAQSDLNVRFDYFDTVPNPVDTSMFKYRKKEAGDRFNVLLLRPFHSRKYANDVAVKAIRHLSRMDNFEQFRFSINGAGRDFARLTKSLSSFRNIDLNETFLSHNDIAQLHRQFGIFLCPTRQDAQGVSMCEAMSSGLVPVTSNNTAIPEFVQNGETGFLTHSAREIAGRISELAKNPDLFLHMSEAAAAAIREKAGLKSVIQQELRLIENHATQFKGNCNAT